MAPRKTWLWILAGALATLVVVLVALAAAGAYLITRQVQTRTASEPDAHEAFESVIAEFPDASPLYTLDEDEQPQLARDPAELPRGEQAVASLSILAWDPDEERLVRLSLPFWMLRFGDRRLNVGNDDGWRVGRLDLDVDALERLGPIVVFDYRDAGGERVLVWTH